jgi:hypothetical protein
MDVSHNEGGPMKFRHLVHALRWAIIVIGALFVAGVFPFSSGGADGLTGATGPVTVTVTSDAAGLASIHATAPDGISIYSLTAHICMPGKVNGDHAFDFSGPFCTNAPVGQSDVEKLQAFPGVSAADLQFQLGTGTANWTDGRGFPHSLTCDPSTACDLSVRIEITNSTAYFNAPFTWGTPLTEPPPAPPPNDQPAEQPSPEGGSATATTAPGDGCTPPSTTTTKAADGDTPTTTTTTAPESSCGQKGKKVPGGGSSTGSGNGGSGPTAGGTSHSSSRGSGDNIADARDASSLSVPGTDSSRGTRVFVAALLGALCGARILAVISRTRRRGLGTA